MAHLLPRERLTELDEILQGSDLNDARAQAMDMEIGDVLFREHSPLELHEEEETFAAMSEPRRRYLACHYLENEVNVGGFNQFLLKKGPDVARGALAFLEERGIDDVAELLRAAIAALPDGGLPDTILELRDILADDGDGEGPGPIDRALDELDDRFFALDPYPPMNAERLRYAREHAEEFFERE
jgi:hypothetical protein